MTSVLLTGEFCSPSHFTNVNLKCPRKVHTHLCYAKFALAALLAKEYSLTSRRCTFYDLSSQVVPYRYAWDWQKLIVDQRCKELENGKEIEADTVILLQHQPVYTLGTRSTLDNLKFDPDSPPAELFRTERGGEVTYHGPGQLVMYPILDLRHHKMDLHWYLRSLEEVVILTLKSACNLDAYRVNEMTGVWVDGRKLAAIGVRVTRWITYHGLSLNVTTDMAAFDRIVPCGLQLPVGRIADMYHREGVSDSLLLDHVTFHLLRNFSSVFNLDLVSSEVSH